MSSLEAARAVVPAWVRWSPFLFAAVTGAFTWLLAWLVTRPGLRAALALPPEPWTERARTAWSARAMVLRVSLLAPAMYCVLVSTLKGFVYGSAGLRVAVCFACSYFAAIAVGVGVERRLLPDVPVRERWIGLATRWLGAMPHVLIAIIAAPLMPERLDAGAVPVFAVLALVLFFLAAGGGMLLIRALGLARPPSPRLSAIVERAARQVGTTPRVVLEMRMPQPNAFALPLTGILGVTSRALDVLDDEELGAICAHELGHLSEPRPIALLRTLGAFTLVFSLCWIKPVATAGGLGQMFLVVGGLVVMSVLLGRMARRMEVRADRAAHGAGDGVVYARALERVYRASLIPAVMSTLAVHPSLYDRMIAAGVTPAYPRPKPPARGFAGTLVLGTVLVLTMLAAVSLSVFTTALEGETGALMAVALDGGSTRSLHRLAREYQAAGREREAGLIARAALELKPPPPPPFGPFWAELLANADECNEARFSLNPRFVHKDPELDTAATRLALDAIRRCDERARSQGAPGETGP